MLNFLYAKAYTDVSKLYVSFFLFEDPFSTFFKDAASIH
jgi:hypothetical protein